MIARAFCLPLRGRGRDASDDAFDSLADQTVSVTTTDDDGAGDTTAPVITGGQTFSYAENQTLPYTIGTVAATDAVGVTGFSITSGDASGFFAIDSSGVLTLTATGTEGNTPVDET